MIVNPDKFQVLIQTDQLSFNHHIKNICKTASKHLSTLIGLKHLLKFEQRKALVNNFVVSNFNYCFLV